MAQLVNKQFQWDRLPPPPPLPALSAVRRGGGGASGSTGRLAGRQFPGLGACKLGCSAQHNTRGGRQKSRAVVGCSAEGARQGRGETIGQQKNQDRQSERRQQGQGSGQVQRNGEVRGHTHTHTCSWGGLASVPASCSAAGSTTGTAEARGCRPCSAHSTTESSKRATMPGAARKGRGHADTGLWRPHLAGRPKEERDGQCTLGAGDRRYQRPPLKHNTQTPGRANKDVFLLCWALIGIPAQGMPSTHRAPGPRRSMGS